MNANLLDEYPYSLTWSVLACDRLERFISNFLQDTTILPTYCILCTFLQCDILREPGRLCTDGSSHQRDHALCQAPSRHC